VIWSDEASFALFSATRGQWVEAGNAAAPRETVKWPPRIRLWAAISAKGKTPLVRIPKSLTAEEFEKLLRRKLLPLVRDVYEDEPNGFVFMQDGDGTHTAKRVQNTLAEEGIDLLLPWPAHSPDLNPIENAWSTIERHLEIVNPTTEAGLWDAMKEGWKKIDEGALTRLSMSLPKRLEAVKAAQGGHTKY
jgi:transposase